MMQNAIPDMLRTPTQIIENTYNLYCNPQGKRRLPDDFVPGPYDVICARGKKAHESEGNVRFRALVEQHQAEYANCTCKHEKSKIVSYIVNSIRSAASYHQGGFVKNSDGLWFEVGDRAAKEKIGQTFRDLLHTKYSSSTKAKAKARIQKRVEEYNQNNPDQPEQQPPSPAKSPSPLSFTQSTIPLNIPSIPSIPFTVPSLKRFSFRSSDKKKDGLKLSTSGSAPDKPLSDSILRSSVQTVDLSNESMMMSTSTLQLPTDEDWMRLSAGPSTDARTRRHSLLTSSTTSKNGSPLVGQQDIDDIVDAFMHDSTTPYGIFSSSTKSNPFTDSVRSSNKRASMLASSVTSQNNPLLMSSTRSSFMDMDLDGLMEEMDGMDMLKDIDEDI